MNETGYLVITVRTAGGALPVENAIVTVKDGQGRILYVKFTDASGKTPRLRLASPPLENSENPNAPSPPFYTYTVDTDKEGFVSVRNSLVPIYPTVTSIQPVELIPLSEGERSGRITYVESEAPRL